MATEVNVITGGEETVDRAAPVEGVTPQNLVEILCCGQKIVDLIIDTATDEVTITDLDLNAHGMYSIIIDFINSSGETDWLKMYVNAELTDEDYNFSDGDISGSLPRIAEIHDEIPENILKMNMSMNLNNKAYAVGEYSHWNAMTHQGSFSWHHLRRVEIQSVDCLADVSGSLNGKYFLISSPTTDYYVWYDVDSGGTDPEIGGRTGVEVDIITNESINTLAEKTKDVLTDLSGSPFGTPYRTSGELTITNADVGNVTDVADGDTGFTFDTDQQGVSYTNITEIKFASEDGYNIFGVNSRIRIYAMG